MTIQQQCPDCGTGIGMPHKDECDIERCTICGGQRITYDCDSHDPLRSVWIGGWPERDDERSNRQSQQPSFLGVAVLARQDPNRPLSVDNCLWRTAVSEEEARLGSELHVGADLRRRLLDLEERGWVQILADQRRWLDQL
jgi:hypothetical protein